MSKKNLILKNFKMLVSPTFIGITILGNLLIAFFALVFYGLEKNLNPNLNSIMDALWWSFSTATTVGYGDIIPLTVPGKILGILLMLLGTAYFAIYTAFFTQAIFSDALKSFRRLEKEEASIEDDIEQIKQSLLRLENKKNSDAEN